MSRRALAYATKMDVPVSPGRRRLMVLAVGGVGLTATGCMTKPPRPANADGTYCFRIGKSYRPVLTCTPTSIPSEQVEADAKRFEPTPGRLTVYVVRKRWGDTKNVVRISGNDAAADTVPYSFVRWRLAAGSHRLTATWSEGSVSLDVTGIAGDVVYVEVIGTVWAWGSSYRLERGDATESRQRAAALRLIADVGQDAP